MYCLFWTLCQKKFLFYLSFTLANFPWRKTIDNNILYSLKDDLEQKTWVLFLQMRISKIFYIMNIIDLELLFSILCFSISPSHRAPQTSLPPKETVQGELYPASTLCFFFTLLFFLFLKFPNDVKFANAFQ